MLGGSSIPPPVRGGYSYVTPPAASTGKSFRTSSSSSAKGIVLLTCIIILALVIVFSTLFIKSQNKKRCSRRARVAEYGEPKDVPYRYESEYGSIPEEEYAPLRSAVYRDPAGGGYPSARFHPEPRTKEQALREDQNYDPFEDAHYITGHVSDMDYRHPSQEGETDENQDALQQEGDSQDENAMRLKSYRMSEANAENVHPKEAALPGMEKHGEHDAKMMNADPNKVDECKYQTAVATGSSYLDPAKQNYMGPGNDWGFNPRSDDYSLFTIPKEVGGQEAGPPSIPARTDKPSWKRKNLTLDQAMNRYKSPAHSRMNKNAEEMLQRLRDTVEDKPQSEMSEREKDVSTMTLGKLRSRVRGENQQLWRQRQHRVLNSGLGMNEYFANMPYWERHQKANKVIRDFAITALKGNHTNKMDLMRAMNHKMDSPIGSAAADAVLENLYTYHDVDKYGRWTPKKEYENETLEDMVGRVLPHGRACIAGESHRNPQTYT